MERNYKSIDHIKEPLRNNLRTFNKTDSISNIEKWLQRLYSIELKDILPTETYEKLTEKRLVVGENHSSYYKQPKGFSKAVYTMHNAIAENTK